MEMKTSLKGVSYKELTLKLKAVRDWQSKIDMEVSRSCDKREKVGNRLPFSVAHYEPQRGEKAK